MNREVGILTYLARRADGHCGPNGPKFTQHPLRDAAGNVAGGAR